MKDKLLVKIENQFDSFIKNNTEIYNKKPYIRLSALQNEINLYIDEKRTPSYGLKIEKIKLLRTPARCISLNKKNLKILKEIFLIRKEYYVSAAKAKREIELKANINVFNIKLFDVLCDILNIENEPIKPKYFILKRENNNYYSKDTINSIVNIIKEFKLKNNGNYDGRNFCRKYWSPLLTKKYLDKYEKEYNITFWSNLYKESKFGTPSTIKNVLEFLNISLKEFDLSKFPKIGTTISNKYLENKEVELFENFFNTYDLHTRSLIFRKFYELKDEKDLIKRRQESINFALSFIEAPYEEIKYKTPVDYNSENFLRLKSIIDIYIEKSSCASEILSIFKRNNRVSMSELQALFEKYKYNIDPYDKYRKYVPEYIIEDRIIYIENINSLYYFLAYILIFEDILILGPSICNKLTKDTENIIDWNKTEKRKVKTIINIKTLERLNNLLGDSKIILPFTYNLVDYCYTEEAYLLIKNTIIDNILNNNGKYIPGDLFNILKIKAEKLKLQEIEESKGIIFKNNISFAGCYNPKNFISSSTRFKTLCNYLDIKIYNYQFKKEDNINPRKSTEYILKEDYQKLLDFTTSHTIQECSVILAQHTYKSRPESKQKRHDNIMKAREIADRKDLEEI